MLPIVTAVAAAVVAIVAATLWMSRRASRSLDEITEGASRIARGDLDRRLDPGASGGTAGLANAINTMAGNLRSLVQDLTDERNMLAAVLETMTDGVMVVGPDHRTALLNPAAQLLLGMPDGGAIGPVTGDDTDGSGASGMMETPMRWGRDYPGLLDLVSRCESEGVRKHTDLEFVNPRRLVSVIATPLNEGGRPSGVLLTMRDLTGIRQIEESQREFVSNVSHEMRNPLASIKAMVETLEDGAIRQSDISSDFLLRILREIDRMTALSNDLLELSQLEAGQRLLDLGPVDLRPIAQEVQLQFQEAAGSKGIKILVDAPGEPVLATGDRSSLQQVLVNLVENAVKFSSHDDIVTVRVTERGTTVLVEVEDTGAGIPQEDLPFIFERFYKADRRRQDSGTGLGLAIVSRIVTAHGGEVEVESAEGEGSTFRVSLPKADITNS